MGMDGREYSLADMDGIGKDVLCTALMIGLDINQSSRKRETAHDIS